MIKTEGELITRLQLPSETIAIAAQTKGVKEFLRQTILAHGSMNICGRNGAKVQRYEEAFAAVYGESLEGKAKRKK